MNRLLLLTLLSHLIYVDYVFAKDSASLLQLHPKMVYLLRGSSLSDGYFSVLLDLEYGTIVYGKHSGFKGFIRLYPYVSSAKFCPCDTIERISIEFSDRKFGLFEIGRHASVASSMKVDAFSASGMMRDSLYWLAQFDSKTRICDDKYCQFSQIYSPDLFSNNVDYYTQYSGKFSKLGRDKRRDFKLSYISQDFSGFKFGISYIPGFEAQHSKNVLTYLNILQFSAFYGSQTNDVAYKFAVSYEGALAYKCPISGKLSNALFGLEVGANVVYMGFTIGASAGVLGKSYSMRDEDSKSSSYNTLGLGYRIGAFVIGVSYFNSVKYFNKVDAKFDRVAFGFNYKFSNNILSSLEVSRFNLSFNNIVDSSSHGYKLLLGAEFKF